MPIDPTTALKLVPWELSVESGARVARSGRLRDGLVGMRTAARIGTTALVGLILLLPLRLFGDWAQSARLLGNHEAATMLSIVHVASW